MGVFDQYANKVFALYEVEFTFATPEDDGLLAPSRLMGGVPKDPKIIQGWLRTKAGVTQADDLFNFQFRTVFENGSLGISEEEFNALPANKKHEMLEQLTEEYAEEKSTNGFKQDEGGLYIEARQLKAMIKESTNILFAKEKWGKTGKGPKGFVAERAFLQPSRIHLGREMPDGVELVVGHVEDKAGKRSTLTLHEYVEGATINFQLEIVRDQVSYDQWAMLFTHAERNGLGALRSQGYGQFEVTKFERVRDV